MENNQVKFDHYVSLLMAWCSILGKDVAAFLVSQSILETGWFESKVFTECNNMFGMRHPRSRITLSRCRMLNHSYFSNVYDSFVDYLLWLTAFGFNQVDLKDLDRFVSKLRKSPYNPSDKYVDTILKIYKTYCHD